jgi:dihydropteroate synthase
METGRKVMAAFCLWGILNVTPDSFSDGNPSADLENFLEKGRQLVADGADFLDVGGESTRPGSKKVPLDEELDRVIPVLAALKKAHPIPLSVDTTKAEVAEAALELGVAAVNDQWGLQGDGRMAEVVARHGAILVAMHQRPKILENGDILEDIAAFWRDSLAIARDAGIPPDKILLDPGIGFQKTVEQNVRILAHLDQLHGLFPDFELYLGVSRKSVIGAVAHLPDPRQRDFASVSIAQSARSMGVRHFRVHNVALTREILSLQQRIHG